MVIEFSKMHGLGNDFVVIDAINQLVDLSPSQVRRLADRHLGVGCDQVLLVERPSSATADFKYRIFNQDGGEVAQCGNGARCFAFFVRAKHLTEKRRIVVDTLAGQLVLQVDERDLITVNMGVPRHAPEQVPLLAAQEAKCYELALESGVVGFGALSMGNPHAVLRVADVDHAPVAELGPVLERHAWFPERANIGFMQVVAPDFIRLRVFERGVGETQACGSGACAAVAVGIEQGWLQSAVTVALPGGELAISWGGRGQPVMMTGPACLVFDGRIDL